MILRFTVHGLTSAEIHREAEHIADEFFADRKFHMESIDVEPMSQSAGGTILMYTADVVARAGERPRSPTVA